MNFQTEAGGKAPLLLSIGEAAVAARVKRDDVNDAMRNGRLPYVRNEGRRMVSPVALRDWVRWMRTGDEASRDGQ